MLYNTKYNFNREVKRTKLVGAFKMDWSLYTVIS